MVPVWMAARCGSGSSGRAGQIEVLADERTRTVQASMSRDQELIYPPVQEFWDSIVQAD